MQNAIVREITVDKNTGLANGAHFVDRHSGREMHVKAKVVVLAAGCLESTRLLLNSKHRKFERRDGPLPGRSDVWRFGSGVGAGSARRKSKPGLMGGSAFIPRFRNLTKGEKRNFIKGYCVTISSGGSASPNFFPLYGEELQNKLDSYAGSCVSGGIFGERVAALREHVRINKDVTDAWGIPVLHIEARDS